MLLASALTVAARERDIASFPAIRAIIEAISAEPHVDLPFANGAILLTVTLTFRLVPLNANYGSLHGKPPSKLYLTLAEPCKLDEGALPRFVHHVACPPASHGFVIFLPSRACNLPFFDAFRAAC